MSWFRRLFGRVWDPAAPKMRTTLPPEPKALAGNRCGNCNWFLYLLGFLPDDPAEGAEGRCCYGTGENPPATRPPVDLGRSASSKDCACEHFEPMKMRAKGECPRSPNHG